VVPVVDLRSALGSLFNDDLTISAPSIQFWSGAGELTLTDGVSISRATSTQGNLGSSPLPGITLQPEVTLSSGANISLAERAGSITYPSDPIIRQQAGEIRIIGSGIAIPMAPAPNFDYAARVGFVSS
jgi:hypothetical protein